MAKIIISDLHFLDSENFLSKLTYQDTQVLFGGQSPKKYFQQFFSVGVKLIEAMVVMTAIDMISYLTISYLEKD